MSLETRLTALATAVGTDVKALTGGMIFRGTWAAGTYKPGEVVLYNGITWVHVGAASTGTPGVSGVWVNLGSGDSGLNPLMLIGA